MAVATQSAWRPGSDLTYAIQTDDGILAISLKAEWLRADPDGQPLLGPQAVRTLDRLRATFYTPNKVTPGFILSLREAMGLTQTEFGRRLNVTKMTISRWECGTMRPTKAAVKAILVLQDEARHAGVKIDGKKRPLSN
jgi:DNA-binding transcriptional regulator YiaG